jgi:hypothetical protein
MDKTADQEPRGSLVNTLTQEDFDILERITAPGKYLAQYQVISADSRVQYQMVSVGCRRITPEVCAIVSHKSGSIWSAQVVCPNDIWLLPIRKTLAQYSKTVRSVNDSK